MKLRQKAMKPLPEGYYTCKIQKFELPETRNNHPDGFIRMYFEVKGKEDLGEQFLDIYPSQEAWVFGELAHKAQVEEEVIEETDIFVGEEVELFFSHYYVLFDDNGNVAQTVYRKQWNVYEGRRE